MALRIGLIKLDVGRFEMEHAAVWHCITRVHRQIHDHLTQLIGV